MGKKPSVKDKRVSPLRTICEVHREMHDVLVSNKKLDIELVNKMISLLEEAYIMAKKMNAKLRQYSLDYDISWWEKTRDEIVKEKLERRKGK